MTCRHKRAGIVTNKPDGYNPTLPHAAESVCDREACVAAAVRRVAALTNMTAYFRPDLPRVTPSQLELA